MMHRLFQQIFLIVAIQDSLVQYINSFVVVSPPLVSSSQSKITQFKSSSPLFESSNDRKDHYDTFETTTFTSMKYVTTTAATSLLVGASVLSSAVIQPTSSAYAATVVATTPELVKPAMSSTTKKAALVPTTSAPIPGPKKDLDKAKMTLASVTEQRTNAVSELRAAKASADKVIASYNLAKKAAEQSKTSYINANDRLVSMKNVKEKDSISAKSIADQQNKVGTFTMYRWNIACDLYILSKLIKLIFPLLTDYKSRFASGI